MEQSFSPEDELMSALATLHVGGQYSDLTITCADRRWLVHKVLVCSRSGFFDAACGGSFKEASSNEVDLSDDPEVVIEHMINYLYHLDYLDPYQQEASPVFQHRFRHAMKPRPSSLELSNIEDPLLSQAAAVAWYDRADSSAPYPSSSKHKTRKLSETYMPSVSTLRGEKSVTVEDDLSDETHLLLHAQMYAIADKYGIPGLKRLARDKFGTATIDIQASVEVTAAIEEVYTSTADNDRGLRDIVIQTFREQPRLAEAEAVIDTIKHLPSLAFELWKVERGLPV